MSSTISKSSCIFDRCSTSAYSQDSLGFKGSAILQDEEVYVLKECPPAQSIGKTVVDRGYMFVKRRRLRAPRNARICASRVVKYVPQYDEEITPIPYQKPERLVPVQPVANPAPTARESGDDISPELQKEMDDFLEEFSRPEPSSSSKMSRVTGDPEPYVDPDAGPSGADPMDVAPLEDVADVAPPRRCCVQRTRA